MVRLSWTCPFLCALAVACAGQETSPTTDDDDGATSSNGGGGGAGGGTGAAGATGGIGVGGGSGGGAPADAILYAHDYGTLHRADPTVMPLALEPIGAFDCIGGDGQSASMTDLAVNAAGEIWSISTKNIYRLEITGGVVHCAQIIPLNNPSGIQFYGLTFAPKGVLAADAEVLVAGNTAGELWSIDDNGNLVQRGTLGVVPANDGNGHTYDNAGQVWELSGDILFVANEGEPLGFATVRDCPDPPSPGGCNLVDTLIELDVQALAAGGTQSVLQSVRGQIVKRAGCNDTVSGDYGGMYGIAAYQDKVFGFSRLPGNTGGHVVEIDNADGTACALLSFPTISWYGAGITTLVPVEPPPPK